MAKLKLGAIADDKPVRLTVVPRTRASRSACIRRGTCARNRTAYPGSAEAGRAHAGAVYGDGPCFRKGAAQESNDR